MRVNDRYMEAVHKSFQLRRGNRPIWNEEADAVSDWVQRIDMDLLFLENIAEGKMLVDVEGGEVGFVLSQEGKEKGEQLSKTKWGEEMFKKLSEKKPEKSPNLCDRILLLMYGWNPEKNVLNVPMIARVMGKPEGVIQLAMHSLKEKGMIGQSED